MKFTPEQIKSFRDDFDYGAFASSRGTKFLVGWDEVRIECELVEVSELNARGSFDSFTLLFKMPADFPYKQGTMTFEHPVIGKKEILVVALEQDQDSMLFEAVITRPLEKD